MYSRLLIFCSLLVLLESAESLKSLTVGTYNTFLSVPYLPLFQERKAAIISKLNNTTAPSIDLPDVLCLQEVLKRSDKEDIVRGVSQRYKYSVPDFNANSVPSVYPACNAALARVYLQCFSAQCQHVQRPVEVLLCGQRRCKSEISALSQACVSCVSYYANAPNVTNPFVPCLSNVSVNEFQEASGLLLLSKYKLTNASIQYYVESSALKEPVQRGYLSANVKGMRVLCTHLTPVFAEQDGQVPYYGPDRSTTWEGMQHYEVTKLLEEVGSHPSLVVVGDFNHGPAMYNLTWYAPYHYGLMNARGLVSVNALFNGQCTYCPENPLNTAVIGAMIDHVFVPASLVRRVKKVKRIFDEEQSTFSDHYGVSAKIKRRRKSPVGFAPLNVTAAVNKELNILCSEE